MNNRSPWSRTEYFSYSVFRNSKNSCHISKSNALYLHRIDRENVINVTFIPIATLFCLIYYRINNDILIIIIITIIITKFSKYGSFGSKSPCFPPRFCQQFIKKKYRQYKTKQETYYALSSWKELAITNM